MDIYTNIEPTYCPVEYCGLYQTGCSTALTTDELAVFKMNTVAPWNLTLAADVESGITMKYCFKCWGETTAVPDTSGTSNLPTAFYDNLSMRMIRNCKTHIQNVTTPWAKEMNAMLPVTVGILAPINVGSYPTMSVKMSEMYVFIDEYDCGKVTCGLY